MTTSLSALRGWLAALAAMLAGWLGVLMLVALFTDEAPAHVVVFPAPGLVQALPPDVAVLARFRHAVTLRSDRPGLARRLYGAGARIVLPAGLRGCLPLSLVTGGR